MASQVNEMIGFLEKTMTGLFSTHGVDLGKVDNIFYEFAHSRLHPLPDAIEDDVMGRFTPYYRCYMSTVSIFTKNYERWEIRELEDYVSQLRSETRFRDLFNEVGKKAATLFILFLFISEHIRCQQYPEPESIVDYINGFIEGEKIA